MRFSFRNAVYALVPALDLLLIAIGALLAFYLYTSISRTYDAGQISRRRVKPLELLYNQSQLEPLPPVQEELFKKKFLFNQPVTKRPQQEGRAFVLVGISVGKKTLAVIKDTKANKSYYCAVGDTVADFKVKEITKEKVVLESESGLLEIGR